MSFTWYSQARGFEYEQWSEANAKEDAQAAVKRLAFRAGPAAGFTLWSRTSGGPNGPRFVAEVDMGESFPRHILLRNEADLYAFQVAIAPVLTLWRLERLVQAPQR
jgi:hypothetical protein